MVRRLGKAIGPDVRGRGIPAQRLSSRQSFDAKWKDDLSEVRDEQPRWGDLLRYRRRNAEGQPSKVPVLHCAFSSSASRGLCRDEGLDPRPTSAELLFRLPVVRGHPPQEIRLRLLRIHAPDVVLPPHRMTVHALVVPEVEVPPTIEIPDPRAAADFHRLYL